MRRHRGSSHGAGRRRAESRVAHKRGKPLAQAGFVDNDVRSVEVGSKHGFSDRLACARRRAVEDLVFPDKPIAIALQEANDVYAYVANPENKRILEALVAVGMPKSEVTALKKAIDATRDAQSLWVVSRDRSKSDAQKEREAEGIELRSTIIAGARWNLRDDRVAQATVDAIQEGDGVEDLVQDLVDAAALIESRAEAFERDETFDVSELAERARSLASAIRAGLSESRTANKPTDAKVLRDRAFTYLHSRVTTIREAGRYAFGTSRPCERGSGARTSGRSVANRRR